MTKLSVGLQGGKNGNRVLVTPRGELVVAPLEFSTPFYISASAANIPFEVVSGMAMRCFVITGLLIASDRNFGSSTTPERLTIYEANPADLSTNLKTILQIDLLKNDRITPVGLNLLAGETKSLVAIATDSSVDVTIAGYYIEAQNGDHSS